MCERDEWHIPKRLIERWRESDRQCARDIYGSGPVTQRHEFPCLAVAKQARRKTECLMLVLGVSRNQQAVMVVDGPSGSELPNGRRGQELTIGRVYTAVSSATTRVHGDSNANGWNMTVMNNTEMELRVLRPVENGPGMAGISAARLRWLNDWWKDVNTEATRRPDNIALRALAHTHADAQAAIEAISPPPELAADDDATAGFRIARRLMELARPNPDKKVRQRTSEWSRQLKKTRRPRTKRRAVGTTLPTNITNMTYDNSVRVDRGTGNVSVLCRASCGRRIGTWVPLVVVCERYRRDVLLSCVHDVVLALFDPQNE